MTDEELQQAGDGYDKFSKRHDPEGEFSVWKLKYFVRLAYFFGYVNGKKGKDPSNV